MKRSLFLIFALVASISCQKRKFGDATQVMAISDEQALQTFSTYCGACHASWGDSIESVRASSPRMQIRMGNGTMPPPNSSQGNALSQKPQDKKNMMEFLVANPTPKPATMPSAPPSLVSTEGLKMNELVIDPKYKVELLARVPRARSLALSCQRDGRTVLFIGTGGFFAPDKKVYALSLKKIPLTSFNAAGSRKANLIPTNLQVLGDSFENPNGIAFLAESKIGEEDINFLFIAEPTRVIRHKIGMTFSNSGGTVKFLEAPTTIVKDIPVFGGNPPQRDHFWRYLKNAHDNGTFYMGIGSYLNVHKRQDPFATIVSFDKDGKDFKIVARGVRNTMGIYPMLKGSHHQIFFTENGRDLIGDLVPPDELNTIPLPAATPPDFGFPYCHGDDLADPEFGLEGSCEKATMPLIKLRPHAAALGLTEAPFSTNSPGLLIAEHGSWNSSVPVEPRVSIVTAEPFFSKVLDYKPFITGWQNAAGKRWGRPVDILQEECNGDDPSVLISDDQAGAIYRVTLN